MENKQIAYLPFHVINEFMVSPYRLSVIQRVLEKQQSISPVHSKAIQQTLKTWLKVPGFRNAALAPLPLKVKYSEQVFEKNPEYVKHILAGWSEIYTDMAEKMYAFLLERGWKMLPLKVDRSKLNGILPTWPKTDDFESITSGFVEAHPEYADQMDDVTLMTVWVSNRLPVDIKDPMEWEYTGEEEE